ncbi:hypothetical protein GA0115240_135241 [Streptomyces sp. DvalAA-14]|nr:hypothetical protein GA0115240_135241 [Streptomyces sp. DvalAA-14]
MENQGFAGLRVLVTGGSRGLSAATARRFAAAGPLERSDASWLAVFS